MEIKLNLLPNYRKEEIAKTQRLRNLLKVELAITGVIILFFSFLGALNYILDIQFELVSSQMISGRDQSKYNRVKELEKSFVDANEHINEVLSIRRDQLHWYNVFSRLNQIVSKEIKISDVASKDLNLYLVGQANSRDDLIKFRDALSSNDCFSDVNLPLSNLVGKDNVNFQIDLTVREECIKDK